MLVAAIAYQQLKPAVRTRAAELLRKNPSYHDWVSKASASERDQFAFMLAATWPDVIKRAPGYVNDGEHPRKPGTAAQNIGYADKLQHRYWHFVDKPFSPDGTELVEPVPPNAETQIPLFRTALHSSSIDDHVKSYDLCWLIHLVGDVHQPLHAVARFDKEQPEGDEGGNLVSLCSKPGCRNELHGFWDDCLGTNRDPRGVARKAGRMAAAQAKEAAVEDVSVWIKESFAAAKEYAYAPPIRVGPGPFSLTPAYRAKVRQIAAQRIALAGARLAELLDKHLK
jgi:hypothetical protein